MMKRFGIILVTIALTSCISPTGSAPPVRQYVLEYPTPNAAGGGGIGELLKVEQFNAARLFAGPSMLYRKGPFRLDAYHEYSWRIAPAEMMADLLRRDLRHAGIFRAVLSPRDTEEARFILEGGVEEFLEVEEGRGRKARLVATLTLIDLSRQEVTERVVFQKTYQSEALFQAEGASGFAEAMSRAMTQLSTQVIADIDAALKQTGR